MPAITWTVTAHSEPPWPLIEQDGSAVVGQVAAAWSVHRPISPILPPGAIRSYPLLWEPI
jgi:hypothetical protein